MTDFVENLPKRDHVLVSDSSDEEDVEDPILRSRNPPKRVHVLDSSDDDDTEAPFFLRGVANRDRTAAPPPNGDAVIFDMPEVIVLNMLSNLNFLEIIRLRTTMKKARTFIDDHLPLIYAELRRQDPSLPPGNFLPRGARDRENRNFEWFQDQFRVFISAEVKLYENHEDWSVFNKKIESSTGFFEEPRLIDAIKAKLHEEYPDSFFERDGQFYHSVVNIVLDTDAYDLKEARKPVFFPSWIRNITFLSRSYNTISLDNDEEAQVAELEPVADEFVRAVRQFMSASSATPRAIKIKVAMAHYGSCLKWRGFDAIAEKDMTVREYRAHVQDLIAAGNRQWKEFLPVFDSSFQDAVKKHGEKVNEDTQIGEISRLNRDKDFYRYHGGAPYWVGASIVRDVRLA